MNVEWRFIDEELERRRKLSRLRRLGVVNVISPREIEINGRKMLSFASNDYLGLSKHPMVKKRAVEFIARYGTGATASPLVCGNLSCTEALARKIASMKGTECALLFPSGFQANVSLFSALADRESLIISDRLNHASIVMGARLARCTVWVSPHNDYKALRALLEKASGKYSRVIIVTESVFSMDGDTADVPLLVELAMKYSALLVVDEAHATGVMGPEGMGLCTGLPVDVIMGTFSKALGASGAYVACSRKMAHYLVNCCGGFIYSTGLSPAIIGAVDAALDLLPAMGSEREGLLQKARFLRDRLNFMGFSTGSSTTHIVPIIVGDDKEALDLSGYLMEKGIFALAFRPPTVPDGTSRIRISLSSCHTLQDLEVLLEALDDWKRKT